MILLPSACCLNLSAHVDGIISNFSPRIPDCWNILQSLVINFTFFLLITVPFVFVIPPCSSTFIIYLHSTWTSESVDILTSHVKDSLAGYKFWPVSFPWNFGDTLPLSSCVQCCRWETWRQSNNLVLVALCVTPTPASWSMEDFLYPCSERSLWCVQQNCWLVSNSHPPYLLSSLLTRPPVLCGCLALEMEDGWCTPASRSYSQTPPVTLACVGPFQPGICHFGTTLESHPLSLAVVPPGAVVSSFRLSLSAFLFSDL